MAIFIMQGRFTSQYVKGGVAAPEDRHAAMSRLWEQAGGRLISLYYTLGQYDFALISEMPDAQSAAVLPLVISAGGAVTETVTTQAFTTASKYGCCGQGESHYLQFSNSGADGGTRTPFPYTFLFQQLKSAPPMAFVAAICSKNCGGSPGSYDEPTL